MIVELDPEEFLRVLPLYRQSSGAFPLISAVIQDLQGGQVFADEREQPQAAIVVTKFGFMMFVGDQRNDAFAAGLTELFENSTRVRPTYLLWYSPPPEWQEKLKARGPELVRQRERVRFEYRGGMNDRVVAPDGFELQDLTADLISKTEKFAVKLDSRFWNSAADFLEHGLGVCLMKDGEIASLCYAATIADGLAEVDVITDPEFRGSGLATVTTRQFIQRCMGRDLKPTWDCFTYNDGSMKLASKLGFVELRRYAFYSFNVPLSLSSAN